MKKKNALTKTKKYINKRNKSNALAIETANQEFTGQSMEITHIKQARDELL